MEKEKDEQLYNYTSCLRSEFKDPDRLEGCFASLKIYIASRTESINEYDEICHPSHATESSEERKNREYIDTLRERVIRAKEYLRQVEAEKNSFPPLPDLPPTKSLIKISGIVEELSVKKVIGYFDFSEYSTKKARAEEKIKRDNEGASLLLLLQFFAGDAPHARFNDGKRKESQCIYVTGKVDSRVFSGWLRHSNMQVGDYVEIAAMPENNEYRMYAVANPKTRIISTTQNCHFGRKYSNVKEFTILTGVF
ncbi:putative type VI secretion system effector, partial [Rahnella victoriana]|uniref:putative type VI secretion system effector n=1 Tax=Rahnella victoriana TaxID=1510570 RepID=UPI0039EE7CB8